ncbi:MULTISPECIES: hypothetical protein [unclassified Pseudoalteromonas]|uniref:hypothetical protein n=1 Tax=unclassified Pseudoalteromonas TaxID=194690 RepID=UPI00110B257E|nr:MULTISPECIES: hypothetical protein [unclassified Pseudoalteromonas]NHH88312.1 hypothetical protein [Pseudoalteromonas sp. MB47]TMP42496.1 hypothetical protein CWB80_18515 [Pseudoalteromonas sp. S1650]TMP64317.1 hypothetical protein CWB79_21215 [Pseudoalteromonas sp. S1649]
MIVRVLIVCSYFLAFPMTVFGSEKLVFFFENRYGEEIQVSASESSSGEINYTFMISNDLEPIDVFYDYVVSTLSKQNYIYVQSGAPCSGCNVAHSKNLAPDPDFDFSTHSVPMVRESMTARSSLANKFIEGVVNAAGTRTVDEVYNLAKNQKKSESPLKFIVNSRNGIAMSLCEITASGCEDMPEVVVLRLNNNVLVFEIERGNDLNYWERTEKINSAIVNYARAKKYTCRVTFTGDKDDLKSQITCFPSY